MRSAKLVDRPLEFRTLTYGGVATQAFVITNHIRRLKMSDLAKELGSGTLTSEQVDAITHAWLDLRGSIEHFEASSFVVGAGDLEAACKDSVQDLEEAFPFLLEGVDDEEI